MEIQLKQIKYLFFIIGVVFSQSLNDDMAYRLVLDKLNGEIPDKFVQDAFSHEKIEIHKVIAERFARPYEKKSWSDYRKIFVKPIFYLATFFWKKGDQKSIDGYGPNGISKIINIIAFISIKALLKWPMESL